ncbi:retrotransposon protein, putative, ty3-gypsy subclass [Tanacetum coccineum]|uniref:Retrotransposon protein, putative, ty3-gypsy subclass n=1 Tax=Tanacetum coccineum TaxID=301880 RepID=A0ABQ4XBQ5_9ASTR
MVTLKFADTHNLVAFLSKSTKSDGFEQIVDFLNARPIKYALTINPTIYTSCIEQFWSTINVKTINEESQLHALVDGKKIFITEASVRRDLQLADKNGVRVTVWLRAPLLASSSRSRAGQWNITKTDLKANTNELVPGANSVVVVSVVPLNLLGNTFAQNRVESSNDKESLGEDASKHGRIDVIDADKEITLVSVQNVDEEMFDVNVLDGEEVVMKGVNERSNVVEYVVEVINTAKLIIDDAQVSAASDKVSTASAATTVSAATTTTVDDLTLAQALQELKSTKPKMKGVVIQELGDSTTTISSQQFQVKSQSQDKGKWILVEELVKPTKQKDQIRLDKQIALRLQAEFDEEERLERENAQKEEEANIALIQTWDDIQAKIDVDHQLPKSMKAQEQEELSIEEKATLFQQLLEKRRKHFAAKREEEKRNKPPTRAQQRKIMCNYLKNMEGYKLKDLKLKEFDSIQEMFDRAFKRVNTFEDFRTDLVKGKEKRARAELVQEVAKKQKVEDDKEIVELKQLMEIDPDEEEVTIDVVPLAIKSPIIMYTVFSHMLKSFDMEDLENLYKLVKAKYGSIRPVESLDLLLWGDLKTMFEPHVEDEVWKLQHGYKVLSWKLYDSCGVHSMRLQSVHIHMLVEKKYPLTLLILSQMLEKKLRIDYEKTLHDVRSAYATISNEESHRVASGSIAGSFQRNQASAFVSNMLNKNNFQKNQNFNNGPRPNNVNNNRQNRVLKENQHMTHTDKELDNVYDISHIKIKVGHPNETEAFISKIGNLRLGHLADPVLNVLKTSLQFDNKNQTVFYEICQRAKKTREPFPLSDHISKLLDDLMHLYLWGPYMVTSSEGFKYFLTVVDDYTRVVWDYVTKKADTNVFQDLNHINFFDIEYPEIPNDNERVDPSLNSDQRSQSDSSHSFVPVVNVNTADFLDDNPRNDAQSSDDIFATQDEQTDAMNNEMDALLKNDTWDIVDLPKDRKILRFLKGSPGLGIHIIKNSGVSIRAFLNVDWVKCVVTRKSMTGYYVVTRKCGKTIKVEYANQIADILTKGLDTVQHKELVKNLVYVIVDRSRKDGGLKLPCVDSYGWIKPLYMLD